MVAKVIPSITDKNIMSRWAFKIEFGSKHCQVEIGIFWILIAGALVFYFI